MLGRPTYGTHNLERVAHVENSRLALNQVCHILPVGKVLHIASSCHNESSVCSSVSRWRFFSACHSRTHASGLKSDTHAASLAAINNAALACTDSLFRESLLTLFNTLKQRSHSTEVIGIDATIMSSLWTAGQLPRKKLLDNEARKMSAGASRGQWLRT